MTTKSFQDFDNEDDLEDFLNSVLSGPSKDTKKSPQVSQVEVKDQFENKNNNREKEKIIENDLQTKSTSNFTSDVQTKELLDNFDRPKATSSIEPKETKIFQTNKNKNTSILDELLNFDDEENEDIIVKANEEKKNLNKDTKNDSNLFHPSGNKRQVRFQNEDSDENPLFLSTAPTSLLSDINKKSSPDWLGETFGTNTNNRPRPNSMEGSLKNKTSFLDEEVKSSAQDLDFLFENSKTDSSKPQKEEKSLIKNKENVKTTKFSLDFLDDLCPKTKKIEQETAKEEPSKQSSQQSLHLVEELKQKNAFLEHSIEVLKQQHQDQINLLQSGHQKRLEMAEENFEKCMETLKERNALLSRDLSEKIELVDAERMEELSKKMKRFNEFEEAKEQEIAAVKAEYKRKLSEVKQDHEEALQRVMEEKRNEMEVLLNGHTQIQKLDAALNGLQTNKEHLQELKEKVEARVEAHDAVLRQFLQNHQHHHEIKGKDLEDLKVMLGHFQSRLDQQQAVLQKETFELSSMKLEVQREKEILEKDKVDFEEFMKKEKMRFEEMKLLMAKEKSLMECELDKERSRMQEAVKQMRFEAHKGEEVEAKKELEIKKKWRQVEEKLKDIENERMELELLRDELKEDKRKVERNKNELRKEEMKIDELNENLKQASSRLVNKNKELDTRNSVLNEKMKEMEEKEKDLFSKSAFFQSISQRMNMKKHKLDEDCRFLSMMKKEIEMSLKNSLCTRCGIYLQGSTYGFEQRSLKMDEFFE